MRFIYKFRLLILIMVFATGVSAANYTKFTDVIVKSTMSVGSNTVPNSKAALDVSSTTLGFLPPRMTTAQKNAIASPTAGLQLYDSDTTHLNYYNGSAWRQVSSLAGTEILTNKTLTAPTITTPSTDIITFDDQGSTPANPSAGYYKLYFKSDGKAYKLNSAGSESELGGGSGSSSGINMLAAYNRDAEINATTYWTNDGGGTFTTTTTAANVGNGAVAFSYDASASSDSVYSDQITIPAGLYGANCMVEMYYKGFDSNIDLQVTDGVSTVVSSTLTASTNYTKKQVNFVCPSSGTLSVRIWATGDAAIGYFDEVHLGSASNIANLTQVKFIGSAYYATTASCAWTNTGTSLDTMTTDADCPNITVDSNPGPGTISTSNGDKPEISVTNLPPGRYLVEAVGTMGPSGTGFDVCLAFNDGTTTGPTSCNTGVSANTVVRGSFIYTTTGTRTFTLWGSASSGTQTMYNDANLLSWAFYIYQYPSAVEQVMTASTSAVIWSGYHDSTCSFSRTNTAYGDPTADASCALVESSNRNAGTVSPVLSGADDLPGISFTPPRAGFYEICAAVNSSSTSGSTVGGIQMVDGSATVISEGYTGGGAILTGRMCATVSPTANTAYTAKLQTKASTGSVVIGNAAGAVRAIEWTVRLVDQQVPAPILVNSVVSSLTGVTGINAANINCDAGSAITSQAGSWVSSVGNVSGGACAVTLSSYYSSAPYCWAIPNAAFSTTGLILSVAASSSTALSVDCEDDASGACTTYDFNLFCMGAK